jgi:hypothetical protein
MRLACQPDWLRHRVGYAPGTALIQLSLFKRAGPGTAGCPAARLPCGDDLSTCLWTMEKLVRRLLVATAVAAALLTAGCTASAGHPAASPAPLPPDPHTASVRWSTQLDTCPGRGITATAAVAPDPAR